MDHRASDMDAIIREEKRLVAVESYCEAWAEGVSAGIEPEIIAEAALTTALEELYRTAGEKGVLALLERMKERALHGDFEPETPRH